MLLQNSGDKMYSDVVLICGGRGFEDKKLLYTVLESFVREGLIVSKVIHGGARGADSLAGEWAKDNNVPVRVYNADWKKYGKSAGMIRNKEMLKRGKPSLVIAFPVGCGLAGYNISDIVEILETLDLPDNLVLHKFWVNHIANLNLK